MNCQELRKDIETLRSSFLKLKEKQEQLNNSEKEGQDFLENLDKIEAENDVILEKYLDDFIDKNSEILITKSHFSEYIDGFDESMCTSAQLPDGRIFCGGDWCAVRIFDPQTNTFSDNIDGFNGHMATSTQLPDGRIFCGGAYGAVHIFDPQTNTFSDNIDGFNDNDGVQTYMQTSTQLPDGRILCGGKNGTVHILIPGNKTETIKDLKQNIDKIAEQKRI